MFWCLHVCHRRDNYTNKFTVLTCLGIPPEPTYNQQQTFSLGTPLSNTPPPQPTPRTPLPMDYRAAGQENRVGRVRELESQLEEVRTHYHHRLRSLENQLQVLSPHLSLRTLSGSAVPKAPLLHTASPLDTPGLDACPELM